MAVKMSAVRTLGFLFCIFLCLQRNDAKPIPDADESDSYVEEHPEEFGDHFEGDMIVSNVRNALTQKSKRWPGGRVYYKIDKKSNYTSQNRENIQNAIDIFAKKTCIRWIERTTQKSFVKIFRGKGCYSVLGRSSKGNRPQKLSLGTGCLGVGTILHEMLHAIGFVHEQSRADRDDYIKVMYDNIQKGKAGNFKKYSVKAIQHLDAPYDYGSIMHYGKKAFSKNKKDTIRPIDRAMRIGQRARMSNTDILKVNRLYQCDKV